VNSGERRERRTIITAQEIRWKKRVKNGVPLWLTDLVGMFSLLRNLLQRRICRFGRF
jgi:hypothetical protein